MTRSMADRDSSPDTDAPVIRRRWPYPFAVAVGGSILVVAFVANFPAVEVSRPGMHDGKYGPHFELVPEFEHGWPARYVRRDTVRELNPPIAGQYWEKGSIWAPWEGVIEFWASGLVIDLGVWMAVCLVGLGLTQWWRSRRQAVWQLHIIDLFGIVVVTGVMCAWFVAIRTDRLREKELISACRKRSGGSGPHDESDAAVPGILPARFHSWYRAQFASPKSFDYAELECACRFPRCLILRHFNPPPNLHRHLLRMPQLEAIDFSSAYLPLPDESDETYTVLRDLPPMPNLRGINLYDSDATDSDMAWLPKCPRLERIELSQTSVGDEGIRQLAGLSRLAIINLPDTITDEGCRHLARFPALKELSLGGSNIHDEGIRELAKIRTLRRLFIFEAEVSRRAVADLRSALPECEIDVFTD